MSLPSVLVFFTCAVESTKASRESWRETPWTWEAACTSASYTAVR